jgi:hypothetical protein
MSQLHRILNGQVHALAPSRGDEVRGVASQQQAPLLHGLGHPHTQIEKRYVTERNVSEPFAGAEPR